MGKEASEQVRSGRPIDGALRERYLKILERTPLFQALPRRHRRRIPKLADLKSFGNGDVVVCEGDEGDSFYVILEGNMLATPVAGHEDLLWSQDSFGELSLIDGTPRAATVTAAGPVTAAAIARADFQRLLHDEPELAVGLLPGLTLVARDLTRAEAERIPDISEPGDRPDTRDTNLREGAALTLEGKDALAWSSLLGHIGIFAGLSEHQRRRVARMFTIERFGDEATVVAAGARGDSLHIILEGRARVRTPSGHTRFIGADDCFGELALLDGAPRAATVSAVGQLTTAKLPRADFSKLLKTEPGVAVGLLTGLVQTIRDLQKAAGAVL
jgi:CRP-like cAMP-binding protein